MRSRTLFVVIAIFVCFASLTFAQDKRALTVEDLWNVKRVSSPEMSPDGKWVAVSVTTYGMEENKGTSDIWLLATRCRRPRLPLANCGPNQGSVFRPTICACWPPRWAGLAPEGIDVTTITWGAFFLKNLIPVTIGNTIGGVVFVGLGYWGAYLRPSQ